MEIESNTIRIEGNGCKIKEAKSKKSKKKENIRDNGLKKTSKCV